jgi:glucosylceramidase
MKWRLILWSVCAGAALLLAGEGSRAVAGFYIQSAVSGKFLDVPDSSLYENTHIQQFHFTGGDNQLWDIYPVDDTYFLIANRNSGLVLDIPDGSTYDNVPLQQFHYTGYDNQLWRFDDVDGSFTQKIVNKNSGKLLDVPGSSYYDHAIIQQFHDNGGYLNQQWILIWDGGD